VVDLPAVKPDCSVSRVRRSRDSIATSLFPRRGRLVVSQWLRCVSSPCLRLPDSPGNGLGAALVIS